MDDANPKAGTRLAWIDCARGLCILLVVLMHSTLGTEAALDRDGWLHPVVAFAAPFRIPAFFLVAGLLVSRVIDRDWRTFLDRRVVHFAYFYVLWLTIQFAWRSPLNIAVNGPWPAMQEYLLSFVDPFGTLWFIYLLPIFFVVVKLTREVPAWLMLGIAALLEIAPVETGWVVIDEFAQRFVFFYSGYALMRLVARGAFWADRNAREAALLILIWAAFAQAAVSAGWSALPVMSLLLGYAGAFALVGLSALLVRFGLAAGLAYLGRNSLAIYLAFTLPMALTRILLVKLGWIEDAGSVAALVTAAAIMGPLLLAAFVRDTRLRFLFERPDAFRLAPRLRLSPQA